jgi:HlyD family secretion protein
LLEIGDPEAMEVVTDLLSTDAVGIAPGAAVEIDNWGGPRPLRGKVRNIEPSGFTKVSSLGVEEQRVNVHIDLVDPRATWERLGHGYRVVVRIARWSSPKVLRVPVSALFRQQNRWAVFTVSDGRARLTPVAIDHLNDELAEVLKGLKAGDRVILHPGDKIVDGRRIVERET